MAEQAQGNGSALVGERKSVSLKFKRKTNSVPVLPKVEQERQAVEVLTAYDEEVAASSGKLVNNLKVIPKLPDSWRPEKRMKNLVLEADISVQGTEARFQAESLPAGPKPGVVYGLHVTEKKAPAEEGGAEKEDGDGDVTVVEAVLQYRSFSEMEDEKLRLDMLQLPDEASLEQYESMPVEDFGEALLRGMGWEKGKPIGRRCKEVVEPVQYERRETRLGLGAKPVPVQVDKNGRESRGRRSGSKDSVEHGNPRGSSQENGGLRRDAPRQDRSRVSEHESGRESKGRQSEHDAPRDRRRNDRDFERPNRVSDHQASRRSGHDAWDSSRRGSERNTDDSRRRSSHEDEPRHSRGRQSDHSASRSSRRRD